MLGIKEFCIKHKKLLIGSVSISAYDVITWFFQKDYNIVIKRFVDFINSSNTEVIVPIWSFLVIIFMTLSLITLWDQRHKLRAPKPIVLTDFQEIVVKYWQDNIPSGNLLAPQDLDVDDIEKLKKMSISDRRKLLISLEKLGILKDEGLGEKFSETEYSMTTQGYEVS